MRRAGREERYVDHCVSSEDKLSSLGWLAVAASCFPLKEASGYGKRIGFEDLLQPGQTFSGAGTLFLSFCFVFLSYAREYDNSSSVVHGNRSERAMVVKAAYRVSLESVRNGRMIRYGKHVSDKITLSSFSISYLPSFTQTTLLEPQMLTRAAAED